MERVQYSFKNLIDLIIRWRFAAAQNAKIQDDTRWTLPIQSAAETPKSRVITLVTYLFSAICNWEGLTLWNSSPNDGQTIIQIPKKTLQLKGVSCSKDDYSLLSISNFSCSSQIIPPSKNEHQFSFPHPRRNKTFENLHPSCLVPKFAFSPHLPFRT